MEALPRCTEGSPQNSTSDLDTKGQKNPIEKNYNIMAQVEELESKFNHGWKRFIDKPCVDQCGQAWMIWKNGNFYQIYVIPPDAGKFKYVIVDYVSTTSYPEVGFESSQFSVGFDENREPIILNVVVDDKGGEYCHLYNQQEEIERAACKSSGDIKRGIGTKSVNAALVTVA